MAGLFCKGSTALRGRVTGNLCLSRILIICRTLPLSAQAPHLDLLKDEISCTYLPRLKFPGRTIVIRCPESEQQYTQAIEALSKCGVLGFDTEAKPSFQPGSPWQPPSVVQLSSRDTCVLWQLRRHRDDAREFSFPPKLLHILQSTEIKKVPVARYTLSSHLTTDWEIARIHLGLLLCQVGHGAYSDAVQMLTYFGVNCRNILDTFEFASCLQCLKVSSLRGLCAVFLGKYLSKPQGLRLSNWGREHLSPVQVEYACADAWSSLEVYQAMSR